MSCANPTTDGADVLMPRKLRYDKSKTCVKCKEIPGNIVIRHAVYCKDCFFPLISHRFRRALEPHVNPNPDGPRRTALKPTGDLLIGLSGGLGSSVLLHLVHRSYISPEHGSEGGRDHPRHERVWKKISACYVEVCDAFPGMKEHTEDIRHVVEHYTGIDFIPVRISDAFDPNWWDTNDRSLDLTHIGVNLSSEDLLLSSISQLSSPTDSLRTYLSTLPTDTARSSSLQTIIRLLLYHTALRLGCSHLLLGTSLSSLAVSLISSISQGGGFNVKEEFQEEWVPESTSVPGTDTSRSLPVRVIRPLRDIGTKECGMYAYWRNLRIVGRESWEWPGGKPGIQRLTKDFIVGLEKDYSSTVSTIVRTCAKVAPKGKPSGPCLLCSRPIQEGVQEWKARISIRSTKTKTNEAPPVRAIAHPLTPHLCYACHTTLTSRSPRTPIGVQDAVVALPVWTSTWSWGGKDAEDAGEVDEEEEGEMVVRRRASPERVREVVREFLLEEE